MSNLSIVNTFGEANNSNKSNKFSTVETNSSKQKTSHKEMKSGKSVWKANRKIRFKKDSRNTQKAKHYKANKNRYLSTKTIVNSDNVSTLNLGSLNYI